MNQKVWTILVLLVVILTLVSFLFLFASQKIDPMMGSIPYVFWVSFGVTCLVVIATFVGSRVFPFEEIKKP